MSVIFGIADVVEYADVQENDAMPANGEFETLCKTYRDSVEIVDEDPETAEEYSDQDEAPIVAFLEAGKTQGRFSTFDFSAETLKKLMPGGTVVDGDFTFPTANLGFETALRFKTDSGHVIAWPKVKLFAKKNMQMVKKGVALIDVTFTPLSPATISKP